MTSGVLVLLACLGATPARSDGADPAAKMRATKVFEEATARLASSIERLRAERS